MGTLLIPKFTFSKAYYKIQGQDIFKEGNTPALLTMLPEGTYQLSVESESHAPINQLVQVKAGKAIRFNADVEIKRNVSILRVLASPEGADVKIDGAIVIVKS